MTRPAGGKPRRMPIVRCPECDKKMRMQADGTLPGHVTEGAYETCSGSGGFYVRLQPAEAIRRAPR